MTKTITENQILGDRGVNLIQAAVLNMGFTWHGSNQALEGGIDGWVELRDKNTGEVANSWIAVQSKAVSSPREDDHSVKYTPTLKDVEYWLKGSQPVLLIVSVPDRQQGWWVSVKDYYAGKNITKDRMITFDKASDLLSDSTAVRWKALSEKYGDGTYFTPVRRQESLPSNMIEVTGWSTNIYSRKSIVSDAKTINAELRKRFDWASREWVLKSGRVYSFHDLSESDWDCVCEGATESDATSDFSLADDNETKNLFVQLLNRCLSQFVRRLRMRYSKEGDCYYFHPEREKIVRVLHYKGTQKKTKREVVKKYLSKADNSRIAYYRHDGFRHRFLKYDGQWYLMIEPEYVYTKDGELPDPYREERKAGIKAIEGDAAIFGTIAMFCDLFKDRDDMHHKAYEFLKFGAIVCAQIPAGIDDSAWRAFKKEVVPESQSGNSDFGKGLFDL